MSTVVRPSGHLPPRVYWIRRLLLLAVLAILVWAAVRAMSGSDPQASGGAGADSSTATPETGSSTDATRHRKPRRTPSPGVSLVPAHFAAASQRCDPATVDVLPEVSEPVRVGEAVPLTLLLTTSVPRGCTLELDSSSLLVAVTSGDRQIWSSTRCTGAVPTRQLVVRPHWSTLIEMAWSGRLGRGGCDSTEPAAPPGTYTVQAALVEGEPGGSDFRLRPAAPKRPPNSDRNRDGGRPNQT